MFITKFFLWSHEICYDWILLYTLDLVVYFLIIFQFINKVLVCLLDIDPGIGWIHHQICRTLSNPLSLLRSLPFTILLIIYFFSKLIITNTMLLLSEILNEEWVCLLSLESLVILSAPDISTIIHTLQIVRAHIKCINPINKLSL
jgi:hypothetical protein